MSKSSDFLHIVSKADDLTIRLNELACRIRAHSGVTASQALRQDVIQLFLRFTAVRAHFVASVVDEGLLTPGLSSLHDQFSILTRAYARDSASLRDFLNTVLEQLTTQSIS